MTKILIEKATVELALESLKELVADPECDFGPSYELQQERQTKAIAACRKALAQPSVSFEQEPIGWTREVYSYDLEFRQSKPQPLSPEWQPCFTAPPQRKPLTEEQIIEATEYIDTSRTGYFVHIARAIEAAHGIKEKNT